MNRDDLSAVEMTNTTCTYLDGNQTVWGGVKAIADTLADVKAQIATIGETDKKQQSPTTGAKTEKRNVRSDFEDQILVVADQLAALGAKTNDAVLESKAHLSLPVLDKLSVDELEATGKRISELATANLAGLADYNITAADVTKLDGLRTQFGGVKNAPRSAIVDRKKETDVIPGLVTTLRSTLRRQLDRQMTRFKRTNGEFYAGYLAARVIVDKSGGGGKKKPATPTPTPQ